MAYIWQEHPSFFRGLRLLVRRYEWRPDLEAFHRLVEQAATTARQETAEKTVAEPSPSASIKRSASRPARDPHADCQTAPPPS